MDQRLVSSASQCLEGELQTILLWAKNNLQNDRTPTAVKAQPETPLIQYAVHWEDNNPVLLEQTYGMFVVEAHTILQALEAAKLKLTEHMTIVLVSERNYILEL